MFILGVDDKRNLFYLLNVMKNKKPIRQNEIQEIKIAAKKAAIDEVIKNLLQEVDNESNDSIALPIWRVVNRLREKQPA